MENTNESNVQDKHYGKANLVCACGQCYREMVGKPAFHDFLPWELKEWLQGYCPKEAA